MTLGINMLKMFSSCIQRYKHMTLAISMLNNIFSLHTKTQKLSSQVSNVVQKLL